SRMKREAPLYLSILLFCTGALLLDLNGCGSNPPVIIPPPPAQLKHVVIVFQENRTPDNLFHDRVLMARGADIASTGVNSLGQTVTLSAGSLGVAYNPNHSHRAFLLMYDKGKMDGADLIPISCPKGAVNCPPPNSQFAYVNPSEVQPYFQLAEQYTFGDR